MEDDEENLFVAAGAAIVIIAGCSPVDLEKKIRQKRRWWRTQLYKKRNGNELMADLRFQEVSGQYKTFTRMSSSSFENLLKKIGPTITKKDTNMREAITAQDR